jgi:hypothetical protein
MQDSELEALLKKYRPVDPPHGLERRIFDPPPGRIARTERRTWPWAVAAAALLAITVGLHAFSISASPTRPGVVLDEQRVQAVADEIGGPNARVGAEHIVRQEQRADADAMQARLDAATTDQRQR